MCKRNNSLDIAKGLAVLLMIWGIAFSLVMVATSFNNRVITMM